MLGTFSSEKEIGGARKKTAVVYDPTAVALQSSEGSALAL
jgi:hypothetical protein